MKIKIKCINKYINCIDVIIKLQYILISDMTLKIEAVFDKLKPLLEKSGA
jgi:hypothetical protein